LTRPGGNMTGASFGSATLQPKRLELLHELVPPPATIAWLRDPNSPSFEIMYRRRRANRLSHSRIGRASRSVQKRRWQVVGQVDCGKPFARASALSARRT